MNKVGVLLLAAGSSQRMGSPKQLLEFEGKTLIAHALDELAACEAGFITVVLGAHAELIQAKGELSAVRLSSTEVIVNPNWEKGMGTSIAFGMQHLMEHHPELTHVLIALVDQPKLLAADYMKLIAGAEEVPAKIIAAYYDAHAGAPMIFPRTYFGALLGLRGDQGARNIVRGDLRNVIKVPMPQAALDWDRPEDVG